MTGGLTTYDEIEEMVVAMRAGDKSARDALVEAHLGLAVNVSKSYDDDEALGVVLLRLVEAVDEFKKSGRDARSLSSFLKTSLTNAAIDYKRSEIRTSLQHPRSKWPSLAVLKGMIRETDAMPEFEEFEQMDELLSCCESDLDRQVLALKLEGLNYDKISYRLGVSRCMAFRAMTGVSLRWSMKRKLNA